MTETQITRDQMTQAIMNFANSDIESMSIQDLRTELNEMRKQVLKLTNTEDLTSQYEDLMTELATDFETWSGWSTSDTDQKQIEEYLESSLPSHINEDDARTYLTALSK